MPNLADPSVLGPLITAAIIGIIGAINWFSKNKLGGIEPSPSHTYNADLAEISEQLAEISRRLDGVGKAKPRMNTAQRNLRDRCIRILDANGVDDDDIAAALTCTQRVVRRVLA